jgi:hypothetical protein
MQNLYDLLGVHPEDDAENLRKAFRKAAKESHPDHHGGNPQAAVRFRQISAAYDILRDAEQRAAYDQVLEVKRRPLRAKLKQAFREIKRHMLTDAIVGLILAAVLAGGYEVFVRVSEPSLDEATESKASQPAEVAAVGPGASGTAERDRLEGAAPQMPIVLPVAAPVASPMDAGGVASAGNNHGTAEMAETTSHSAGGTVVATADGGNADVRLEQAATGDSAKNQGSESPDQPEAPSGVGHDKTPEPASAAASDVRQLPESRATIRSMTAGKRQSAGHSPVQQVSLENRSVSGCSGSQSCAGDMRRADIHPLFGVGF